jgi:hypothetical protein
MVNRLDEVGASDGFGAIGIFVTAAWFGGHERMVKADEQEDRWPAVNGGVGVRGRTTKSAAAA